MNEMAEGLLTKIDKLRALEDLTLDDDNEIGRNNWQRTLTF